MTVKLLFHRKVAEKGGKGHCRDFQNCPKTQNWSSCSSLAYYTVVKLYKNYPVDDGFSYPEKSMSYKKLCKNKLVVFLISYQIFNGFFLIFFKEAKIWQFLMIFPCFLAVFKAIYQLSFLIFYEEKTSGKIVSYSRFL